MSFSLKLGGIPYFWLIYSANFVNVVFPQVCPWGIFWHAWLLLLILLAWPWLFAYGFICARYDTTLCSCQCEQHVLKAAWSKRGGNILLGARFWVALLKSSLCSCNGFAEAFGLFLTEDFFFFLETFASLLLIYSFTYFKMLGACLLILGAVFLSAWWTGDLRIQIPHGIGWSQPFPLSYAYKIGVVTGLPAFINVFLPGFVLVLQLYPLPKRR